MHLKKEFQHTQTFGHILALATILVWGTTFISSKVLLEQMTPIEILLIRFVLGYIALWTIDFRTIHLSEKQELLCCLAGLTGPCLYYYLENEALTMTTASLVGILVSTAPLFTALFEAVEKHTLKILTPGFLAGFACAMAGILLLSHTDSGTSSMAGIALSLLAAAIWAIYSIVTRKISTTQTSTILTTRRIFFYGIVWMLPIALAKGIHIDMALLFKPEIALNQLYLGLGACAFCFVSWNKAIAILGTVQASAWIYLIPAVTVVFSILILHEPFTWKMAAGILLVTAGLALSETKKDPQP